MISIDTPDTKQQFHYRHRSRRPGIPLCFCSFEFISSEKYFRLHRKTDSAVDCTVDYALRTRSPCVSYAEICLHCVPYDGICLYCVPNAGDCFDPHDVEPLPLPTNESFDLFSTELSEPTFDCLDTSILNGLVAEDPTLTQSWPAGPWEPHHSLDLGDSMVPQGIDNSSVFLDTSNSLPQSWHIPPDPPPTGPRRSPEQPQQSSTGPEYVSTEYELAPSEHLPVNLPAMENTGAMSIYDLGDSSVDFDHAFSEGLPVHEYTPTLSEYSTNFNQPGLGKNIRETSFQTPLILAESVPIMSYQGLPEPDSIGPTIEPARSLETVGSGNVKLPKVILARLEGVISCPHCSKHFAVEGRQFK